jgi:glycosyltransferase involved in cell wall biosynthesis
MKILQFVYSLGAGGAERFVLDLTNELAENNETVIFTLRDSTIGNNGFYLPDISKNVKYVDLKIKEGFKPSLVWRFYKILKSEKPDIVHCHLNLVNYFFLLSIVFRKKIRFIYTIHNAAESEVKFQHAAPTKLKFAIERAVRKFFFRHRFFIPVAISAETKSSYQEYYKLKDVLVIYNGRKFSGKSKEYESVVNEIEALKSTPRSLVFCHIARYHEQKNQKMLVSVFNTLRKEGNDIILLIIGDEFNSAPELKASAMDHIHFLGIRSNATDYLYASDAFCLSSIYEGMPISLIEAFACACIPICTPVGGCINTIENGITGYLSKSVSEADYLEAIKQFIGSRLTIDKENLIKIYHDRFSIEQCTDSYLKLYSGK